MNSSFNANCDNDERVDLPSTVLSVWMSGLYLAVFSMCALFGSLSWQYVNSMNCMTFGVVGIRGAVAFGVGA